MPVTKLLLPDAKADGGKHVTMNIGNFIAEKNKLEHEYKGLFPEFSSNTSTTSSARAPFSEFSMKFNLEEFEFAEDDSGELNSAKVKVQLDVTALDRYNEDIRKYRKDLLEECRLLPLRGDVDMGLLERVRIVTSNLCRSCYYGTYKAHSLAESSIVILVWLLSRRNLPILFQIRVLQSMTEMVWTSALLKVALVKTQGIRVLVRLMKSGMVHHETLACWAAYALLACAIGSGKVIEACRKLPNIDEYVGEMAFPNYWRNWPANFGSILQGVLYGPNAVAPLNEDFEFM